MRRIPIPRLVPAGNIVRFQRSVRYCGPAAWDRDNQFTWRLRIRFVPRGKPAAIVGRLALRPNLGTYVRIRAIRADEIYPARRLRPIGKGNGNASSRPRGSRKLHVEPLARIVYGVFRSLSVDANRAIADAERI